MHNMSWLCSCNKAAHQQEGHHIEGHNHCTASSWFVEGGGGSFHARFLMPGDIKVHCKHYRKCSKWDGLLTVATVQGLILNIWWVVHLHDQGIRSQAGYHRIKNKNLAWCLKQKYLELTWLSSILSNQDSILDIWHFHDRGTNFQTLWLHQFRSYTPETLISSSWQPHLPSRMVSEKSIF